MLPVGLLPRCPVSVASHPPPSPTFSSARRATHRLIYRRLLLPFPRPLVPPPPLPPGAVPPHCLHICRALGYAAGGPLLLLALFAVAGLLYLAASSHTGFFSHPIKLLASQLSMPASLVIVMRRAGGLSPRAGGTCLTLFSSAVTWMSRAHHHVYAPIAVERGSSGTGRRRRRRHDRWRTPGVGSTRNGRRRAQNGSLKRLERWRRERETYQWISHRFSP